jgi:hypothetical protein
VLRASEQRFGACLMAFVMFGLLLVGYPGPAGATDQSNDGYPAAQQLEIWVGYSGDASKTYTKLKTLQHGELEARQESHIYTFIDNMPCTVVDPAVGIKLTDILDLCEIDENDVNNFRFWTSDVPGQPYQTLSKDFLLYTPRYYFPNIADNWELVAGGFYDPTAGYGGDSDIYFPDSVAAAAYAVPVPTMLAFRDKWQRVFSGGSGDTSLSGLTDATRYRLVFGHPGDLASGHPTHTASKSSKWVYRLDVTLNGTPAATGITLDKTTASITAGDTCQLTATVGPSPAANQGVTWTSSDTAVATVNSTGLVKAVAPGSATVTATTTDGGFTATCSVTVRSAGGGGGGPLTPSDVISDTGSATVNPSAGGTVSLGGEASIGIPPGALNGTNEVNVTIQKLNSPPASPSGFMFLGSVYEFSVGGSASYDFNKPVTLTFAFDPADLAPGQTPSVHYYDQGKGQWVNLGGTVSGNTITVTIDHFTRFAVLAGEAGKAAPPPVPSQAFSDVPASHWANDAITSLAGQGYISGYPDGSFRPGATITRAEFVAILVKAFKLPAYSPATPGFSDVSPADWHYSSVESAVYAGIIKGYGSAFGPDDPVTREQMAVMITKVAGLSPAAGGIETKFADSGNISGWAVEAVAAVALEGIVKGYPDNTFRPQGRATRAEAVTVVINALNR